MVINMVTELGIKMDEHHENFNKEIKKCIKNQPELKNTTELKSTLEGINSRLDDIEEWTRDLEDKSSGNNAN